MKIKNGYAIHTVCLTALFMLGSAVIVMPVDGANDLTFLAFLLSCAVAVLGAVVFLPIIIRLFQADGASKSAPVRAMLYALWIAVCIAVLADAAVSFGIFTDFAREMILPEGGRLLLSVLLFCAVLMPSVSSGSVVLKFSLFSFFITAAAVILFLAASLGELRFENIILLRLPEPMATVKQTVPYLLRVFLPLLILYIYVGVSFGRGARAPAIWGVVAGSVLLGLCLLNTLLLFGAELSAELEFPYASAVSTITLGELFSRMDGVSYFIYFASCTVRLAVCVSVVKKLMARMGEHREKRVAAFALALAAAIGYII